ncbi:DUF1289 domain-containing protein [Halomonas sp. H10-9-1]|uniref:DUF1289 domain-containing protein n=1 Tax=Halomonas sp. H10-9-1 TaxID=2950871 RepID=UPI0032DEDBDF
MSDARRQRPVSPCVRICRVTPDGGGCEGCGRTLGEIAAWAHLDEEAREAVWQRLEAEGWSLGDADPA